ncbi:bifunctional histidinol-phosphatase/imidazoleglycerol-phosphate dehydratase HisB [Sediminitomix flava]|uniref:Histidine biosynthesis bifunctional protein HisB n=1 Tax=Sediminitomix flava TaxID=379075 RepID=A0A316A4N0_SEDFL|nr:bifunctional histidinol-phosphatase/imidazoleglycerol-phosphate dehydratase HisB [Sediminitomix flava]PWJ44717.1 imidazoleglycerol-phosphate dehydratase [Sediminitomix flava]
MRKKVLFIDRDGTLIVEPPTDYQVDSLEKLEFIPKVLTWLGKITNELDYEVVMVTNQDGLGTDSYPESTFWPAHDKMLKTFEGEGVTFKAQHIDRTFEEEKADTRKPRTGMLTAYFDSEKYDLENSFVIGDRKTDVELAQNLGSKSIYFHTEAFDDATLVSDDWEEIFYYLKGQSRTAHIHRKTYETDIAIHLDLDGNGKGEIQTGIGFFDHMLEQVKKHAGIDLSIKVNGDLYIDEHHTIEDTALALGEAFYNALGDKRGIERYGFYLLAMDETLAQVALDFSGRPWLVWNAPFNRERVGGMPTEMFMHFFKSFSDTSKANLNIKVEGDNEHHMIESIFKGFARAIKMAIKRDVNNNEIPSTKGVL